MRPRHYLSNVDDAARIGDCSQCGPRIQLAWRSTPGRWQCLTARRTQERDQIKTPEQRRRNQLRSRYGMAPEDYDALIVSQGGTCAICDQACRTGRRLAVDHDHSTGAVRGLLCQHCNQGIGFMRDDPELLLRAAQYVAASANASA